MKINNIAFVGIPVTDVPRARKFQEEVLGLGVSDEMMGGKWIEYAVGDHTLAIANIGGQWKPSDQGTGAAFEVETTKRLSSLETKRFHLLLRPLKRRVVTWRWCKIPMETNL